MERTKLDQGPHLRLENSKSAWDALITGLDRYADMFVDGSSQELFSSPDIEEVRRYIAEIAFDGDTSPENILSWFYKGYNKYQLHTNSPNYFGVFNPTPGTMGVLADACVSGLNPQLASSKSSMFCIAMEDRLISYFGKKFGYLDYVEGNFTSGGTEANTSALLCALAEKVSDYRRNGVLGLEKKPVIYCSKESHHSIKRAARMCGLGTNAVREIPVTSEFKMCPKVLEESLKADSRSGYQPLFVVATLGTTNAGVVDDLGALGEIANRYNCWFHVDAAWGGASVFLPEFKVLTTGLSLSDSVCFDPHKWLSQPMGVGLFLTKHPGILKKVFSMGEASHYMPQTTSREETQPYTQSMQWSRRFLGLKVFFTLAVHGEEHIQRVLRHQVDMGNVLRSTLQEEGWQVINNTPLPVVCFSKNKKGFDPYKIATEMERLGEYFVTPTTLNGIKVLRAGSSNLNTQKHHVVGLVKNLTQVEAAFSGA